MSRWVDKWTGYPKNRRWKKWSDYPTGPREQREKAKRGYLKSPLTTLARRSVKLSKVGNQLEGSCPACAGKLLVSLDKWRCLGCAVQERLGDDLAGMVEYLSQCPNAVQQKDNVSR